MNSQDKQQMINKGLESMVENNYTGQQKTGSRDIQTKFRLNNSQTKEDNINIGKGIKYWSKYQQFMRP